MSGISKAVETRKTRIQEKNAKRILAAAEEVFAHNGYNGAVIERIAERANISKPNLLYYFKNKESLYQAVLENTVEMWLVPLEAFDAAEGPAVAFERYIRVKIEYSRTRPYASKVWANELISGAPYIGPYLQRRLQPLVDSKVELIRDWINQGKMDDVDPYHLFFLIWAATQTYADFGEQAAIVKGKKRLTKGDFQEAANVIVSIVLKGAGMKPG